MYVIADYFKLFMCNHFFSHLIACFRRCLCDLSCFVVTFFNSTLVIGGAGSLMLDLYGWESVFYVSGLLSVLWAYCMWKYLLKGEGKGCFVLTITVWCYSIIRQCPHVCPCASIHMCLQVLSLPWSP